MTWRVKVTGAGVFSATGITSKRHDGDAESDLLDVCELVTAADVVTTLSVMFP